MKLPIFTDEVALNGGWHGTVLTKAFENRGYQVEFVNLQDCLIDLSDVTPSIQLPQFDSLPKIIFVRGVAGGSLQQVITRLNILHALRMQGVHVYNDASAIERTVDKGMTSFLLQQAGVSTPATWVTESRLSAHAIIHEQLEDNEKLVIKPLFGSQGNGVRFLDKQSAMPLPRDEFMDGVFYLQSYIDTGEMNHDFRVFVINNKAVAAMRRSGEGWLNNVAQGSRCELIKDVEILKLAEQAARAIDISYCGVDIMRSRAGELFVLEVNSIPAWRGLQAISDVDIAQLLVDDLVKKVSQS